MVLFERMGEQGQIRNREQFKKVEDTEYFEFKKFQIRILCRFQPGRRLILVHGFRKKKDRISRAAIEKADRIFAEYTRR